MDSCPELLVTHEDGHRRCIDTCCVSSDSIRHEWRLDCTELDEPCRDCTEVTRHRHRRAA